jgi:hypothetical protein
LGLVDLGDDRVQTKRRDPVPEHPVLRVEILPLPGEQVDCGGDLGVKTVPGAMIAVPVAGPSGIGPAWLLVKISSSCP